MKKLTHVVYRKEVHSLYDCSCDACIKERKRRKRQSLPKSRLSLPPSTAYLFGLIPSRHPKGSLARELMDKEM